MIRFSAPLRKGAGACLFPFAVGDRLLTFDEEAEGVGFSPWVKKPKAQASHCRSEKAKGYYPG